MNIGVIGSGTMGAGIAQVAAAKGNRVVVVDMHEAALQKASDSLRASLGKLVEKTKISAGERDTILENISWQQSLSALSDSELIIEAVVEHLDVKQQLFRELESIVAPSCILASNTSSLSITSIASACHTPERVIGIHFFNPATLMQLVEIIPALQTKQETLIRSMNIIASWGKQTVIAKDTPGFIVNRVARPFYSEAIRLLDEGFATIEAIDEAMRTYGGFKMGPFELMDLIGHDVNYTVTETVWKSFYYDSRYTPSFTQKRLVEANWLGRKSGRGFYNYAADVSVVPTDTPQETGRYIFERILLMLINEAANALFLKIASREDIELAMTRGVNYPKGLLKWADEFGIDVLVDKLDELYQHYHEDRYRCCPLLRRMKANGECFF